LRKSLILNVNLKTTPTSLAMMTRKDFLLKGTAALGGASLLAGCTSNQSVSTSNSSRSTESFTWNMVTTWPPNFPVLGEACNIMAELVEKMSGGRLKINVYGGGELVPALEVFDAVSSGAVQLGNGAGYYWAGKVPAAQFFATVPFGMNAQQVNAWLIAGGGQELWDEVYARFNLKSWPGGNTGVQMGGWFNKEINSVADLKGLKMRIPGIGGKVITKAGGSAINVAGGEIYTNLERGVIDATEWIGPYHDYRMGFHKIAKFYYYPGWHEPGTTLETMVNLAQFNALPDDLKAILETAVYRMNVWVLSTFEAQNNLYLNKLVQEENVQLRKFPTEVLQEFRRLTTEVLEEIAAGDAESAKVYAAYKEFQQNAAAWSELTEKIFQQELQG